MFDLAGYMDQKCRKVDAALERLWDRFDPYPTVLLDAMQYSVKAGGKRLRPLLCIAAAEAVGGSDEAVMDTACALELIHTYSLIHDDLPAMDDDDFRRGKPTSHKVFGEATAILAGDALLTAAFEVLSCHRGGQCRDSNDSIHLEIICLLARAAGASGMVQGQMLDLSFEGKDISWENLKTLQQLKTGALIQASLQAGAVLGGGNAEQVAALRAYGAHVGLAFQVADDVLDVEGDAQIIGKPVGSDQMLGKATGPSVLGLETAKTKAQELVGLAVSHLDIFGNKGEALASLSHYIVERDR
jgi:geranylgeranyl diphosphate synthase type II